ncbi:predicted protein [Plenodomus lingam JN3]|uniref:Predicted protein n=1 Tax=Leptosphaeria maculans (strain JN3 / isolate v23.1.3 / race Av1-4-5-6-7-8) TaxID=985895 RepID=E4ZP75_LEPMJ|nr:predicted protein [Plenodomus lingam JN3]CBX93100.1 predicted protein [Plenodomus lingam JN3]
MPPPPTPHASPPLNQTPYFSTVLNNPPTANNPSSPSPRSRPQPRPAPDSSSSSSSHFTAGQRNAQARHKEWTCSSGSGQTSRNAESYEQRQERDRAATILDSVEMLMWFAAARNESIPQTRHYYQNIVLGLKNEGHVEWREEWELPLQERGGGELASPTRSGQGKERERVKKRVSSAHTYTQEEAWYIA